MHRNEIKGSVLVGMRRVASAKLLNQQWHEGGVQGRRVEEHETGREMSAVSFSIKNSASEGKMSYHKSCSHMANVISKTSLTATGLSTK